MKRMFRGVLFCPLHRGKSGAAVKGVASAASQSAEWLFCDMTLKVNPVTLTIYSSPIGRYHNPQRRRRCRPLSEAMQPFYTTFGPKGRQPFPSQPFYTTRGASRAPFLKLAAKPPPQPSGPRAPSTLPSEPFEPFEPSEPSRRRRVQERVQEQLL